MTREREVSETLGKSHEEESWKRGLNEFMNKLCETVEYESGSLFLFDNNSLHEVASKGDGIDFISSVSFPMGKGLSAWVAQKGKMIYLPDIHRGSRHGLNPVRSYLSLPLELNNRIIGVLNLGHVVPNAFSRRKMKKIQAMSQEIARKIYNRLYLNFSTDGQNDFTD